MKSSGSRMRAASISVYSMKKTPFCLRCSICCSPAGMGFLLWASAIIGFLSPTCMGHPTSVFSRCREGRSSVHGAASCNYSLISTRVTSLACGFANCPKATRADSLAIAAGGLRATGRLSFKTGVFGAIEPPKAARRAPWGKTKTQCSEFEMSFWSCPSLCPRGRRNATWRYLAALGSRRRRKPGATGMTGRQNRHHRVGVNKNQT